MVLKRTQILTDEFKSWLVLRVCFQAARDQYLWYQGELSIDSYFHHIDAIDLIFLGGTQIS